MAQETKVEETSCSLQTFERNRYFYGKPMTVSDFEAEQRYLVGKHRYINRLIHGAGVLCGLQVTLPESFSSESPRVEVAEGAALDCCGNLIIVSRSGTAEIKGDFDPEGLSYLYLKYAECSKQPVVLSANGSSCEEVCCYNRIQETFEIVASRTAPGGGAAESSFSGAGAQPSRSLQAGLSPPDPKTVCRSLTEQYYQEKLRTCPGCDDPLVFLAVLDPENRAVDEVETAKYRTVVYNNSMLHELLCGHVTDFNNPHRTSAEQVRALQSVNGVGNVGDRAFVANINLASKDKTIGIVPDVNGAKVDLNLAANAVKLSHVNEDVIKHLLQSSKTVTVEPNAAGKKITLHTTPAKSVTSVGSARAVGASSSFAPEDHAHDLAEDVVGRKHFNEDVFANLVQGDGRIKVEPDLAAQTIRISTEVAPADDPRQVSSVAGMKSTGKSERYAREDHAHDLHINGRSPDGNGQFRLSPGANVRIADGDAENELIISAEGGSETVITTGIFIFEDVKPQEVRTSTLISHRLEEGLVAILLAEEDRQRLQDGEGIRLSPVNATARFGDFAAFDNDAPFLMAIVDYAQKSIQISLKDRRQIQGSDTFVRLTEEGVFRRPTDEDVFRIVPSELDNDVAIEPDVRTYRVRWWAIQSQAGISTSDNP